MQILSLLRPFCRASSKIDDSHKLITLLLADSVMSWYVALEFGNFCFPAQVYNRENGHVGFMLSCYVYTFEDVCYSLHSKSIARQSQTHFHLAHYADSLGATHFHLAHYAYSLGATRKG